MNTDKQKTLSKLKIFYVFVFILGTIIIIPTHIFPPPLFMPFRFPHYLETMGPFLGFSWPMSFEIYHYALYVLAIIGSLNVIGIFLYPRFKNVGIFSSIMGIFIFSLMVLFFFFKFISVNALTAAIYGLYSLILLSVDILTFKALITKQKEASAEQS